MRERGIWSTGSLFDAKCLWVLLLILFPLVLTSRFYPSLLNRAKKNKVKLQSQFNIKNLQSWFIKHWYKDEKFSTRVKDEEGFPCFALVNKATGQAMKHSIGATHPVQLIPYNPNILDESILWTKSRDIRVDALH